MIYSVAELTKSRRCCGPGRLNTGGRVKLVAETEAFLAARMMRVLFLCHRGLQRQ